MLKPTESDVQRKKRDPKNISKHGCILFSSKIPLQNIQVGIVPRKRGNIDNIR